MTHKQAWPVLWVGCALFAALPASAGMTNHYERNEPRALYIYDQSKSDKPADYAVRSGSRLKNPIRLAFRVFGMRVAPAGDMTPGTGHLHLLINTTLAPDMMDKPIPYDEQHIHYGNAETEAVLNLPPGQYTLQLVMADGGHVPLNPPLMTEVMHVTVE